MWMELWWMSKTAMSAVGSNLSGKQSSEGESKGSRTGIIATSA